MARSNQEEQESSRVLLCVSGLSPQIITETLYAISRRDGQSAVPQRIIVITTARGRELIVNDLLDPAGPRYLQRLQNDHQIWPERQLLQEHDVHIVTDHSGEKLDDIRTRHHNESAADLICQVVRELTETSDGQLHASIAGGRKTMGFFLGHAMSLFARPQDELSHVLINSPFEAHPEFYFPPREPQMIRVFEHGRSRLIRTDNADIALATIPVVRLRESLPAELMDREVSYSEAVSFAQRCLAPPKLIIDLRNRCISCSGQVIPLPGAQLALMAWMADRIKTGLGGVARVNMDQHGAELVRWRARVTGGHSGSTEAIEAAEFNQDLFDSTNSRLKAALVRKLGHDLARRYQIGLQDGKRNRPMTIGLNPQQIEFGTIATKELETS